jgi:hypothetical protein
MTEMVGGVSKKVDVFFPSLSLLFFGAGVVVLIQNGY